MTSELLGVGSYGTVNKVIIDKLTAKLYNIPSRRFAVKAQFASETVKRSFKLFACFFVSVCFEKHTHKQKTIRLIK